MDADEMYHKVVMAMSGTERMQMGAALFEAAQQNILASLPNGASTYERRRALLRGMYGSDFTEEELRRIEEQLKSSPALNEATDADGQVD